MDRDDRRRPRAFRPDLDGFEARLLLDAAGAGLSREVLDLLRSTPGHHPVRPNTPVLPFAAPLNVATFLDPSSRIVDGDRIVVGQRTYVGPYATLDARHGAIKVGAGAAVLDNATVAPGPGNVVQLGDFALIGFGAEVRGDSRVGAYGEVAGRPTGVGPNARIDGAVIEAGAVVGALARVGPGVTVPAGMYVLPGVDVTTDAEASDPALGKVIPVPAAVAGQVSLNLTRTVALAAGYTNLYQGQSATGVNQGVDPVFVTGVYNGNLAAVSGTSRQPGPATSTAATGVNFEPNRRGPQFPSPRQGPAQGLFAHFRARITGDARFLDRAANVSRGLGRSNAFRADQGQPFTFRGAPSTGHAVTINAPLGGTASATTTRTVGGITFGAGFRADDRAVILGGSDANYGVGDGVTVGAGAVVERSDLGAGASIGARAYVADSTLAPGQVIPPGTIYVNNQVVRSIEW